MGRDAAHTTHVVLYVEAKRFGSVKILLELCSGLGIVGVWHKSTWGDRVDEIETILLGGMQPSEGVVGGLSMVSPAE